MKWHGPLDVDRKDAMQIDRAPVLQQLRHAFPPAKIDADGAFATWGTTYSDGEAYEEQLTEPGPKIGSWLGKRRFDAMVNALTAPQRAAVAAVLVHFAKRYPQTLHESAARRGSHSTRTGSSCSEKSSA